MNIKNGIYNKIIEEIGNYAVKNKYKEKYSLYNTL